jgi:hypothetical protein
MRQIRITKRHRSGDRWAEPLPLDPRDPDIVRAKERDRGSARTGRSGVRGQGAGDPDGPVTAHGDTSAP